MKKTLNVKNMVETYFYSGSCMREVWNSFLTLRALGFITENEWDRFYERCGSWDYCESLGLVVDANGRQVIL